MIGINEKVYQMENLRAGQVYLILDGKVTLIDTGMLGDFKKIKKQLNSMNIKIEQIDNIIITHGHMDHVGNLKKLAAISQAKIFLHRSDYPMVEGKFPENKLVELHDKYIIDVLDNLEVIHIPGHTEGNIALYAESFKILFAGDCLFNERGLAFPPTMYNKNTDEFMRNVAKLLDYDIEILCPGHGLFLDENVNQKIKNKFEGK